MSSARNVDVSLTLKQGQFNTGTQEATQNFRGFIDSLGLGTSSLRNFNFHALTSGHTLRHLAHLAGVSGKEIMGLAHMFRGLPLPIAAAAAGFILFKIAIDKQIESIKELSTHARELSSWMEKSFKFGKPEDPFEHTKDAIEETVHKMGEIHRKMNELTSEFRWSDFFGIKNKKEELGTYQVELNRVFAEWKRKTELLKTGYTGKKPEKHKQEVFTGFSPSEAGVFKLEHQMTGGDVNNKEEQQIAVLTKIEENTRKTFTGPSGTIGVYGSPTWSSAPAVGNGLGF